MIKNVLRLLDMDCSAVFPMEPGVDMHHTRQLCMILRCEILYPWGASNSPMGRLWPIK